MENPAAGRTVEVWHVYVKRVDALRSEDGFGFCVGGESCEIRRSCARGRSFDGSVRGRARCARFCARKIEFWSYAAETGNVAAGISTADADTDVVFAGASACSRATAAGMISIRTAIGNCGIWSTAGDASLLSFGSNRHTS